MGGAVCDGAESAAGMATGWRAHHVRRGEQATLENFDRCGAGAAGNRPVQLFVVFVGRPTARADAAIPASSDCGRVEATRSSEASMGPNRAGDLCVVLHSVGRSDRFGLVIAID